MSATARPAPLGVAVAGTDPWYTPPITTTSLRWALLAMVITTLPFLNDVPRWIPPIIGATIAWRYIAHVRGWPLPHVAIRMGWAFANFGVVFVSFGNTINGLEPGTALLLLMSAMKLTESARARDLIVVVYMAFFNVVTHALFDQQIASTLYGALALVVVIAALLQVTRRTEPIQPRRALSRSGILLAQALPLMLLMFLLFPRVPGPFWALPTTSKGVTGLSDSMKIGGISELLESGATAFRARFDGALPPPAQRYWRGPVFDLIVGNEWSANAVPPSRRFDIELGEPSYAYDLTMEAHQRRWVFALDLPAAQALPAQTQLTSMLQLLADKPLKERLRLPMRAFPNHRVDVAGDAVSGRRYLDVSGTFNPRTEAWARELRERYGDNDDAVLSAVLTRFSQAPFAYTLRPPPIEDGSASDVFLFETRSGFCEHYASSFALVMRYAGIPARVVTGYQGGELNPIGRHLTIRQSDAHAWTEIWLAGRGWVRIDPTAAVSPDRVERGITGALGDGESLSPLMLGDGPFLSRLRFGWDAANATWNRHILGYGQGAQRKLLRKLGFDKHSAGTLVALLTASGALFLGALALWLSLAHRRRSTDPLLRGWARLNARLAAAGLPRDAHEAPLAYAERVGKARPDLATQMHRLAKQFAQLRYGHGLGEQAQKAWLKAAARFKPGKTSDSPMAASG